eukprot:COSAG01_NODE_51857_length_351_cov_1.011905_1_plen_70_part_01
MCGLVPARRRRRRPPAGAWPLGRMMPLLVHVLLLQVTGAQLDGVFVGTQTCVQAYRGDFVPEQNFTLTLV